ncbi:hypothetical protein ACLOJK_021470 [Asimina triloba]
MLKKKKNPLKQSVVTRPFPWRVGAKGLGPHSILILDKISQADDLYGWSGTASISTTGFNGPHIAVSRLWLKNALPRCPPGISTEAPPARESDIPSPLPDQ